MPHRTLPDSGWNRDDVEQLVDGSVRLLQITRTTLQRFCRVGCSRLIRNNGLQERVEREATSIGLGEEGPAQSPAEDSE